MEFLVVAGAKLSLAGATHPGDLEVHIVRRARKKNLILLYNISYC